MTLKEVKFHFSTKSVLEVIKEKSTGGIFPFPLFKIGSCAKTVSKTKLSNR